ncbi:exportin-5-like protein Ranbp21 isoform X2 [Oratosquilla oratoria]
MDDLFGFFLLLLEENYCKYEQTASDPEKQTAAASHCRVVQVVLMTLASYSEWVSVQHIFSNNGKLLQSLCFLLRDNAVKKEAAECLLQIVSRKGKPEERRPLLIMFVEEAMTAIFSAADKAVVGELSEHNYTFLKILTQVLTSLGSQLAALWGKEPEVREPPNFCVYLNAMLAFTNHPSLQIYNYTNSLWSAFLRHEKISKCEVFLEILPRWLDIVVVKIKKHGYPSKNDSLSCKYSRLDFESDEDYSLFFYKARSETLESLKVATLIKPDLLYSCVEQWLHQQAKQPIEMGPSAEKGLCNLFSPSYLEWDALSMVLECVMCRIEKAVGYKLVPDNGTQLLHLCLNYETSDPLILSALLSCISGLFVFISYVPDLLPNVLNKIFSALTFTLPGQTKDSRSRSVKNVRRHGCSLMVKIARLYPAILLQAFSMIDKAVDDLCVDPTQLSQMEKVTLREALMVINNHNFNYDKQSTFIGKVMQPVSQIWLDMRQSFQSPADFMTFVGLDKAPVEPSENDVSGQNRAQIIFCVNLLMAVIKRSEYPSDTDLAEKGGFVLIRNEDSSLVFRNPAMPHIAPLLHQLFLLLRVFNALWQPTLMAAVSQEYSKAHSITEAEKNNILGLTSPSGQDPCVDIPKVQQPLDRMQHFLTMVHDNCYHILGNAGPSLGLEFYQYQHLSECLIHSAFSNLHLIPDYRLRPIFRTFLKPFIQNCPSKCQEAVLLPLLRHLFPYMSERLNQRWLHMIQLMESGTYEDENSDTQEVVEDLLLRMLTREYIDVLKVVLIGGPRGNNEVSEGMEGVEGMEGETMTQPQQAQTLSELGHLVLRSDDICQAITTVLLKCLSWPDSSACLKAVGLFGVVVQWMVGEGQHLSPEAVTQLLMGILQGLHVHGEHESNQSFLLITAIHTYEALRPHFPHLREVLDSLPGVRPEHVNSFEQKMICPSQNPNIKSSKVEKMKKELFKKIVHQIVGRNVGQAFKNEVNIQELPPMFKAPRPKQPRIDETEEDIGLCSLFGPQADVNGHHTQQLMT